MAPDRVSPHEAPQGGQVVFAGMGRGSTDLYLYSQDSTTALRLTETPCRELFPVFSGSGHYIVYVSDRDSFNAELYAMRSDGSEIRRLAPGLTYLHDEWSDYYRAGAVAGPQPAPSGDRIAFAARDQRGYQGIYLCDLRKGTVARISLEQHAAYHPAWSARGTYLLYTQYLWGEDGFRCVLHRVGIESGQAEELLRVDEPCLPLGTSRDEERVVLWVYASHALAMFDTTDCSLQPLVEDRQAYDPAWDPWGEQVAFIALSPEANYEYDLYVWNRDGQARRLTDLRGYLACPSFSHDGRAICFVADEAGAPHRGMRKVCRVATAGGEVEVLSHGEAP